MGWHGPEIRGRSSTLQGELRCWTPVSLWATQPLPKFLLRGGSGKGEQGQGCNKEQLREIHLSHRQAKGELSCCSRALLEDGDTMVIAVMVQLGQPL